MNLFDLSNKRALITGGTHGLGMAIALGLANAGAEIIINDLLGVSFIGLQSDGMVQHLPQELKLF